jgi:hypothetical protein
MNNITFGNDHGGYYETVGGGAGKNTIQVFFLKKSISELSCD